MDIINEIEKTKYSKTAVATKWGVSKKDRQTLVDHLRWFVQEQGVDEKCVVYQTLIEVQSLCMSTMNEFFSKTHEITTVQKTAKKQIPSM